MVNSMSPMINVAPSNCIRSLSALGGKEKWANLFATPLVWQGAKGGTERGYPPHLSLLEPPKKAGDRYLSTCDRDKRGIKPGVHGGWLPGCGRWVARVGLHGIGDCKLPTGQESHVPTHFLRGWRSRYQKYKYFRPPLMELPECCPSFPVP